MNVLDELIRFGFQPITEWTLKGERIALTSLAWPDSGGWLYAFVVAGEVKYIGLTDRVLRSRLDNYRDSNESQCARIRSLIRAELEARRSVQVFGLKEQRKEVLIYEESRLRTQYRDQDLWNRI